jgi:hypothetical protein
MGDAYQNIRERAGLWEVYREVYRLLSYVHTQWMTRVGPQVLSVHGQYHATNNTSEVNHAAMSLMATVAHPNAWDVVGTDGISATVAGLRNKSRKTLHL